MVELNIQELEGLADPMRKEVALVRKKVDSVNKELKPLSLTVQKKVWPLHNNQIHLISFSKYMSG